MNETKTSGRTTTTGTSATMNDRFSWDAETRKWVVILPDGKVFRHDKLSVVEAMLDWCEYVESRKSKQRR